MTVAAPPHPVEPREGSRARGGAFVAFLAALRPLQWVKNALVFVPPAAAHVLATPAALRASLPVFVAFCAAASGGYLVNDRLDLASDRLHPRKRRRPLASGALPASAALLGPVLSIGGVALAATVSTSAGLAVLVYVLLSLAYSAVLKTRALVDVFTLALLYAMRLLAGAAATNVVPSPWLIGFSTFLFLGLAFIKRLSEPLPEPASAAASRRGYREGDRPALLAMGTACSFAACLVLALYVGSDMARSLYRTPDALWCLVPLLLFWQCRLWLAVTRGDLVDDPLPFALRDPATWLVLAACAVVFWVASGAASLLAVAPARGVEVERRTFVDRETMPRQDDAELGARFRREVFVAADGVRLPYRLLTPMSPPPASGRPVVLVLHGSGAIGDDNERQLGSFARAWAAPDVAASFPAFIVVPQAAARTADYEVDADGLLASRAGEPLTAVIALAGQFASRSDVDPARVYVVGFSMGGSAALVAVATRPDLFAAAVSFSGIAPRRTMASLAASTPQLLVHGTADVENAIGPDRAWAAAVTAAGGHLRLVEYEGMGHRVPPDMTYALDWREWLFRQRRK